MKRHTSIMLIATLSVAVGAGADPARGLDTAGVRGGFIVHLGCTDGKRTAELYVSDQCIVQGLSTDKASVQKARSYIHAKGLGGKVSVNTFEGSELPYADNLVNLLVAESLGKISMNEVLRVLVPGGVAMVGNQETVKPWPEELDEWTHYLRGAGNNAVSQDVRVGPARSLQWHANPLRSRDHDGLGSISAMTSSSGRLFYILDEGPTSMIHCPPDWKLIARDAFNGKILWKRDIPTWVNYLRYFRSGPLQLPRRLVSVGDHVYVILGLDAPVSILDAATGKTVRTLEGTEMAEEVIVTGNTLLSLIGDPKLWNRTGPGLSRQGQHDRDLSDAPKTMSAYERISGKPLWTIKSKDALDVVPLSLIASERSVYYLDGKQLHCRDLADGRSQWSAPCETGGSKLFRNSKGPTVVFAQGAVLVHTGSELMVFSAEDGKERWHETGGEMGFESPPDLFVVREQVWAQGPFGNVNKGAFTSRLDLATGKIEKTCKPNWHKAHHHRCYRNKATERFLIAGPGGTSFFDWDRETIVNHDWIRGLCQYGIMPANGLLYVTPHPCGCYADITFNGLNAFSSQNSQPPMYPEVSALEVPASKEKTKKGKSVAAIPRKSATAWKAPVYHGTGADWPTYRHDISRSGFSPVEVPLTLNKQWSCSLGGTITSPTMKEGRLYAGCLDNHTVNCIDADAGNLIWSYIAGGPVDSPPTIHGSKVLFGCRDGSVYALKAHDGSLIWRFQVPKAQRYLISAEKIESAWPIHGSVLVLNDIAYGVAGRSSVLDGGLLLFGLKVSDGTVVHMKRMFFTDKDAAINALQPDVLISDGESLVMRNFRFTPSLEYDKSLAEHNTINSPVGILESVWGHRHNWCLGGRTPNNFKMSLGISEVTAKRPFGQLIVFSDKTAYSLQNLYTFRKLDKSQYPPTHSGPKHQHYYRYRDQDYPIGSRFFAQANEVFPITGKERGVDAPMLLSTDGHTWTHDLPLQLRAMVLADRTVFVAGWEDRVNTKGEPEEEDRIVIQARAADDGKKLAEYNIPAKPVYDGLIAANGSLYISLANGDLVCFEE